MVRLHLKCVAIVATSIISMASCFRMAPTDTVRSFGMMAAGAKVSSHKQSISTAASHLNMSFDDIEQETNISVRDRIQGLVDNHPVLLFMKGTKLFPQCGFSNTASQILYSFNIEFHTVDILADEAIRQGVKEFSSWPTIPQLYVGGEFIGGSDIMIELYQNGELGELIEKTLADKID